MAPICIFLLATLLALPLLPVVQPSSLILIQGSVFCDVCHDNTFSGHSYFLSGVNVHLECKFKANSPGTTEEINISVNRTTDRYGVYKLQVQSLDEIACTQSPALQSLCEASLMGSSSPQCNNPSLSSTTKEITIKSKQNNLCIYSMSALSYTPFTKNETLCRNNSMTMPPSLNSSKFFLPYFPPYFPFPQFPPLPPFPSFPFPLWPPLPSLPPLPPLPSLPPLPPLPSLPPLPPLPSLPPFGPFPFPPSPSSTLPNFPPLFPTPSQLSPPPPPYDLGDPINWIPKYPFVPPPKPPGFNLGVGDPKAWTPYYHPFPPTIPQPQQHNP